MHNQLPKKYYFINKLDTNVFINLDNQTALIYRNYLDKIPNENQILKFRDYCKKKNIKFFLANNIKLALKLNLTGCYIPSFNKDVKHLNYSFKKNFIIIGSAHNQKQIRNKELQKVSAIFLSSLFKRNLNFLGINKFKSISLLTKKKIIALGGISIKNINQLKLVKNYGFAGISYFEQKKRPLKGASFL